MAGTAELQEELNSVHLQPDLEFCRTLKWPAILRNNLFSNPKLDKPIRSKADRNQDPITPAIIFKLEWIKTR